MLKAFFLNDQSVCECICPRPELNIDVLKLRQKRARMTYALGLALLGFFLFFVKNYSEIIFWFLYPKFKCYSNTYLHSCFTLVMIYRIAFTTMVYHFILMILGGIRNKVAYQLDDFCWTLKIILFIEFFFITCLVPNQFFNFFGMFFKYVVVLFIIIKTIYLHDAIFFYCNKNRFKNSRNKFKKCWKYFIYLVGIISFGLGLTLFVFSFLWYNKLCGAYLGINITFLCLGGIHLLIFFVKYRFKVEFASSLIFFSVISLFNYGTLAGTPYNKCINSTNMIFMQSQTSTNIDAIFNYIFILIILLFISKESLNDVNETLSEKARGIYKFILLDFEKRDEIIYLENLVEKSIYDQKHTTKKKLRRNKKDVFFHFIMILIGIYYSMLFTSWTSIYEFEFTSDDIIDNTTIWVRFAGTIAGIIYCILISAINLSKNIKY